MTKSQVIAASNGGDYDDIVSELAREKEVAENLGVSLDKDLKLEPVQQQLELPMESSIEEPKEKSKPVRKRRRSK